VDFFYRKPEGLMGLDISSTAIKLVELAPSRGGYELKSMATVPLPRDAIVENTIIDSMAVTQALLDGIEVARPSTRNVALAVSGNAVIIKKVTMLTSTEFDLESQIAYEADQHIPYDIDDVFLDFQILGPLPDDPEQMEVVLVACKRDVVEDYQMVLNEAGLQAKCVDCSVFCLENAFELIEPPTSKETEDLLGEADEGGTIALVNIGASMININILRAGQMSFARDQFFGGNNLTEEIQKTHNLSFSAAERMKLDEFSAIQPDVLEHFYVGLTSELVRSLDFYAANSAEYPVEKLHLTGGCALVPGIANEIEQRLGIETNIINPFSALKASSRKFDADYLENIGPSMMVSTGLALRGFDA